MERTPINPVSWSIPLGFDQAELIEGHRRLLVCSAQDAMDAMDAKGNPQHPGDEPLTETRVMASERCCEGVGGAGQRPTKPWRARYSAASAKGLPSESLQIVQRSPGWTMVPPSSLTRSAAAAMSSTSM